MKISNKIYNLNYKKLIKLSKIHGPSFFILDTIKFRNNQFHKTNELVELISRTKYDLKLRSDQTLVYNFNKSGEKQRISKAFHFIKELTKL